MILPPFSIPSFRYSGSGQIFAYHQPEVRWRHFCSCWAAPAGWPIKQGGTVRPRLLVSRPGWHKDWPQWPLGPVNMITIFIWRHNGCEEGATRTRHDFYAQYCIFTFVLSVALCDFYACVSFLHFKSWVLVDKIRPLVVQWNNLTSLGLSLKMSKQTHTSQSL